MKSKNKIFCTFSTALIFVMLMGLNPIPASAAAGWTQDVNQTDWTIVDMSNSTIPDATLDPITGIVSGTGSGKFDINYEQWVVGNHFEYADKVIGQEGHWGECPEGYTVDPDNEAQCRKLITEGYWDYKPRIIDVPAHYGDCPAGYDVDPNDEAWCTKLIAEGYWDFQPRIIDVPAHYGDCPADYTVDPDNEAQCRKLITEGYWDYKDKIVDVPAHWGECPAGYEVDPDNPAKCRKLITEGYWDKQCTPGECPQDQVFTASHRIDTDWEWGYYWGSCGAGCTVDNDWRNGDRGRGWYHRFLNYEETFTVTFDYGKSSDPHKCHRPTGSSLGIPSWAMSEFNAQFPEWIYPEEVCIDVWIPPVYDYVDRPWIPDTYKCPDGYSEDGGLSSTQSVSCPPPPLPCKKWIDAVYDYKPRPWIPATYKCPDGYDVDPDNPTQCRKYIDAVYDIKPREWIPDTYKCPDGYDVDPDNPTQCRKYIDAVYDIKPREWIPDTYVCPEGYTEGSDPEYPDRCAKMVDDSYMDTMTITYYIEVEPETMVFPCALCVGFTDETQVDSNTVVLSRASECDGEPTNCEAPIPSYYMWWTNESYHLMAAGGEIKPTVVTNFQGVYYIYSALADDLGTYSPANPIAGGFWFEDGAGNVLGSPTVRLFNGSCGLSNFWGLVNEDGKSMTVYGSYKIANLVADFVTDEWNTKVLGKTYDNKADRLVDWWVAYLTVVVPQWKVGPLPVTIQLP
jgi:hypothetical protein